MGRTFFQEFLMISDYKTILFIAILFILYGYLFRMQKKKVKFSKRVFTATFLGFGLGVLLQIAAGIPENPMQIRFIKETTAWYQLFGNGFVDLIRMLVVPLVITSILHVIINMKEGTDLRSLTKKTLIVTLSMAAISAMVGLMVGSFFQLGAGTIQSEGEFAIKEVHSIVDTLKNLVPANPVQAMMDVNIIALVIMAALFGNSAKRMHKKYPEVIQPFFDFVNAFQKILISVAMTIVKYMPYAVVALLATTIAGRGLNSILDVILFIIALYSSVILMFFIHMIVLFMNKINPWIYYKKGFHVFVLAFTSRSSVGVLPVTIETLNKDMGVSEACASFVAGFGTTAGMQGCAGVFPALLIVYVCGVTNTPLDFTMIVMSIIVITIGSLGIAGIPGTATMAASVGLSGIGMAAAFPLVSGILAIDPLIDMGRTLLNVSGSMVNALIVDQQMKTLNMEQYKTMHTKKEETNDFFND